MSARSKLGTVVRAGLTCGLFLLTASVGAPQEAQVGQVVVTLPAEQGAWWTDNVSPEDFSEGIIHLHAEDVKKASLISKREMYNNEWSMTFDFKLSLSEPGKKGDTKGANNGLWIGYQYPSRRQWWDLPSFYWKIKLSEPRLLTCTMEDGREQMHLVAEESLEGNKWYRFRVSNSSRSVRIEVRDAETEVVVVDTTLAHDAGADVPMPIEFIADAELTGVKRKAPAPKNTVYNPYDVYHVSNDWSPYIAVGGYLRDVGITQSAQLSFSLGRRAGSALLQNSELSLYATEPGNGIAIVRTADGSPVISIPGGEARLACEAGQPAPSWKVEGIAVAPYARKLVQVWRTDDLPVQVRFIYKLLDDKPYLSLSMEVENLGDTARVIDLVLNLVPGDGQPAWQKAYTFPWLSFKWKKYVDEGAFPFTLDLDKDRLAGTWGVRALGWSSAKGTGLFLPIVALLPKEGSAGPVLFWDNRTSLSIAAEPGHVHIQRRFYLKAKRGYVDRAINMQDGLEPVPHHLYVGYCDRVDWVKLYNDYYLDAMPLYKYAESNLKEPLVPGLTGGHEAFFTSAPWTEESARDQALSGVRYAGLWFGHANHPRLAREFSLPHTDWARKCGMLAGFSDNIMVAPGSGQLFDPAQHYAMFPDAIIYDADGNGPFINWEGILVSQSPRYSFGRNELALVKKAIDQHGFDYGYLDVYWYGPQCDWTHPYDNLPFTPYAVGITEYIREITDMLHKKGMPYILNAPHHASDVVMFGDIIQGDIGDLEFFPLYFKAVSGCKLNIGYSAPSWGVPEAPLYEGEVGKQRFGIAWGLLNGKAHVQHRLYDSLTRKWKVEDAQVRDEIVELVNRNVTIGFAVGQSRLVAGNVFRSYQYANPQGDIFLTVYNPESEPTKAMLRPDLTHLPIVADQSYDLFEWDIDDGAGLLQSGVTGAQLPEEISVDLDPGEVKVVAVLPGADLLVRDYLAYGGEWPILARFTTGRFVGFERDGSTAILSVEAVPDRRTVTRIEVAPEVNVVVEDAQQSEVTRSADGVKVAIVHGPAPARITFRQ